MKFFFFQAEDGIRDRNVTGVQTCALPIYHHSDGGFSHRPCGKQASCSKARDAFEAEPHGRHSLGSVAQAVSGNSHHLGRLFQQKLDIPPGPWMESMWLHSTQDMPFRHYSATAAT